MTTIHKEGYKIIAVTTLLALLLVVAVHAIYKGHTIYHYLFYGAIAVLWILVVRFFRMPFREMATHPEIVLCPADGKIVAIEEVIEEEYFNSKRIQVSVFMSPNNVHVNRYPVSGQVVYTRYWPGLFLVAWHPKSSTENERNTVVVENHTYGAVLVRQIAGAVARRIVCYAKTGEHIEQGRELGFIKFGSRVDLFLPVDAKILVTLNQKVKGGITAIAQLNKP